MQGLIIRDQKEKGDAYMAAPKDKEKFALWLYPETLEKVKQLYKEDDCISKSEFIEKAIRFYVGFLTAEDKSNFLPNMFLSNMRGIVAESDTRISRLLFKMSVEMAMMMNLLAFEYQVDPDVLERLRGECVKEVRRLNGSFSFEDAVEWQS